jgi:PAN domain
MRPVTTFFTLTIALATSAAAHADQPTMFANDHLFVGGGLVAPSCFYDLRFQTDGNLVLTTHGGSVLWASGTQNTGAAYVSMQADGNLVIYRWDGSAVWATGTNGNPSAHTTLQDDANLVVYHGSQPLWASDTSTSDRIGTNVCDASVVTSTEQDTNRFGGDYVGFDLGQPNPLWCSYYCSQDVRCNAYTYVPPGVQGPNAKCWLKDRVLATSAAPGLVSGVIYR